jgi:hypothetical protein
VAGSALDRIKLPKRATCHLLSRVVVFFVRATPARPAAALALVPPSFLLLRHPALSGSVCHPPAAPPPPHRPPPGPLTTPNLLYVSQSLLSPWQPGTLIQGAVGDNPPTGNTAAPHHRIVPPRRSTAAALRLWPTSASESEFHVEFEHPTDRTRPVISKSFASLTIQ